MCIDCEVTWGVNTRVAVRKAMRTGSAPTRPLLLAPRVVKCLGLGTENSLIHAARGCLIDISTEISGKTNEKLLYCAVGVMEAGVRTPGSRLARAAGNDPQSGGARVRGAPTDRSRMPHVVDDYFTAVQWRWL